MGEAEGDPCAITEANVYETVRRAHACRSRDGAGKNGKWIGRPWSVHTQIVSAWLSERSKVREAFSDTKRNQKIRRILNRLVAMKLLEVGYAVEVVQNRFVSEAVVRGGNLRQVKCYRPVSLLVALARAAAD